MTPGEVNLRAFHYYRQRERTEESAWRREAHFTAALMNMFGKVSKRKIKGTDLYRPRKAVPEKNKKQITAEERRQQALEGFRLAKSKFWAKIKDESLAAIESSINSAKS